MIRVALNAYQLALAVQTGVRRSRLHLQHASRRALSPDYDLIGVAGEIAFGSFFVMPVDLSDLAGGDRGRDFITPAGIIDVKTARKPTFLFLERGYETEAHILVLAGWRQPFVNFLGWEYVDRLRACPYRDFNSGIINHFLIAAELRPMRELGRLLLRNRAQDAK